LARTVLLPRRVLPDIRKQMEVVRRLHQEDLAAGYDGVFLPRQLERNYQKAAREFAWQWFFPAATLTSVLEGEKKRRYHLQDSHVQSAVKQAASKAGLAAHLPAYLCQSLAVGPLRHPDDPEVAWS
jgi:hypothetical protein